MKLMQEHIFQTAKGNIHYWMNEFDESRQTLVLLPGLSADHHLFDKQVEAFESEYNLLVWDAPGHAASRPFELTFTLADKASWLHEILKTEEVQKPILVGQSMGGYVSQAFLQYYPSEANGFISIDSAPLQRKFYPSWELWLLDKVEPMYRLYPWKILVEQGAKGCAVTEYGRQLMAQIMHAYDDDPKYYARLVGHGYGMLADAIKADLPYRIDCPCLLLCGEKDKAGDTKKFNRKWTASENLFIQWIPNAGHNSNTDQPEIVNELIRKFIKNI